MTSWAARIAASAARPHATLREDAVTTAIAAVTLVGLFWDALLHNNQVGVDSFWSRPHLVIYAGLAALGAWVALVVLGRAGNLRELDLSAVPHGYGLGLAALPLAAIGGPADFLWHEAYGFENQIDAPYSPSHLILFLAGAMFGAVPVASAWRRPGLAPGLPILLPAVLSVTLVLGVVMIVVQHVVPFFVGMATTEAFQRDIATRPDAYEPGSGVTHAEGLHEALGHYGDEAFPYYFYTTLHTVGGIMIFTALLVGATLFLLRRWRLPFGAVSVIFTALALLIAMLSEYREAELIPALVAAGLVGDLLLRGLVRGRPGGWPIRAYAAVLAVALWSGYFACVELSQGGLGWEPTLWVGVIAASAGVGFGLALVAFPALLPEDEAFAP